MITKNESPTRDLVFVDADTVDESILKISSKEPYSYYDDFINSRYQVNDPGSQFMYPFDRHETYLHFFVAYDNSNGTSNDVKDFTKIPIALSIQFWFPREPIFTKDVARPVGIAK